MSPHDFHEPHRRHGDIGRFFSDGIRSIIFGLEDSLVSTLGALTGIAAGTADRFVILLAGIVIVVAEALSMTAGEYLSSKSAQEVWKKKMEDEKREMKEEPEKEHTELIAFYLKKGYTEQDASTLADLVSKNDAWALEEMAIHELNMSPTMPERPKQGAIAMFVSYFLGGAVPLLPYVFLSVGDALPVSISATAVVLFSVGALKTRVTHERWWKSGLEMLLISLATALIGYILGLGIAQLLGTTVVR